MKKILLYTLILVSLFSCNKICLDDSKTPASFTAGFEEATKNVLNSDRTQCWTGSETITVYDVNNDGILSTNTFVNATGTRGTTAKFIASDPTFEFQENHYYVATCNVGTFEINGGELRMLKKTPSQAPYNNRECYHMGDGGIPICCMFKYVNQSSSQNLIFKNLGALLVTRVSNNSGSSIAVGAAYLTQINNSSAGYKIFGGVTLPGKIEDNITNSCYDFISCNQRNNMHIRWANNVTIKDGESNDFCTVVYVPKDASTSYDLTVDLYTENYPDISSAVPFFSYTKSGLTGTSFSRGDTKVLNVSINASTKSLVSLTPLDDNSVAY